MADGPHESAAPPAIVTGGGTGIGLAIAEALATAGHPVALLSRSQAHLDAGRERVKSSVPGARVVTAPCNIRDPEAVAHAIGTVASELGPPGVLVNNAAADFTCRAEDLSPNAWRAVLETVLSGSWFCSTSVAPYMFSRGGGTICNILSTVVLHGAAGRGHSSAAKAGVESITRSLAVEWADRGIRVVGVAPGPVDTPGSREHVWGPEIDDVAQGLPLGRMAQPRDVAAVVQFLCSAAAAYVSGDTLVVDGATWLARANLAPVPPRVHEVRP